MNRENEIMLSVLIPSIQSRENKATLLIDEIKKQSLQVKESHPMLGGVEILIDNSKRYLEGGMSIGEKREKLKQTAIGMYVVYLDDDDIIAPNYIESLLRMCNNETDVCTFSVLFKNDHYWAVLNLSLFNENEEASPDRVIKRGLWHVCPIKREIANTESFNKLNHGEDVDWLNRIIPKIKTETHTDKVILQYNHSEQNSEADKIIQHG